MARVQSEFDYVQMELAGTGAGTGRDRALLRVTPVGRDSEGWAAELLAMYSAWATRKGYEWSAIPHDEGTTPHERHGPRSAPTTLGLYIQGSSVYEFLRGEAGLHRLHAGAAEERQRNLARVIVLLVPGDVPDEEDGKVPASIARMLRATEIAGEISDEPAIVRTYSQGRHRFVRDPRTGAKLTDITAVLQDGEIDAFLLAYLRREHAAAGYGR